MGQLKYLGQDAEAAAVADRYVRLAGDSQGVARVRGSLARPPGPDRRRRAPAWRRAHRRWPGERTLAVDLAKVWTVLGEPVRAAQALPSAREGRAAWFWPAMRAGLAARGPRHGACLLAGRAELLGVRR